MSDTAVKTSQTEQARTPARERPITIADLMAFRDYAASELAALPAPAGMQWSLRADDGPNTRYNTQSQVLVLRMCRVLYDREVKAKLVYANGVWHVHRAIAEDGVSAVAESLVYLLNHQLQVRQALRWVGRADSLAEGLADMVKNGRLTESDIPDDWVWLKAHLIANNVWPDDAE